MSNKMQVIEVIIMVLNGSTSNEKRQEAEEYLKQQRNEHAQDYIQIMMECVQQHP